MMTRISSAILVRGHLLDEHSKESREEDSAQSGDHKGVCPLVRLMRPNCYCHELTSQSIELAVRYCLGDYDSCQHYVVHISLGEK